MNDDEATMQDVYEDYRGSIPGSVLRRIAEDCMSNAADCEGDPSVGISADTEGAMGWSIAAVLLLDEANRRDRVQAETDARIAAIPVTGDPWAVADAPATEDPF